MIKQPVEELISIPFAGSLDKVPKPRPQLLEFILNMLSNPWFSSILSWEGMDGQFTIIRPEQVAQLWGERNGRRNMTYQKFSRALRYYYNKKVMLTKIRGQKYSTSSTFKNLSDSMDIEVYHLSLFISPLETANTWFPPLRPTVVMHFQPVIPSEVLSTI